MQISKNCLDIIKKFEGFRPRPYLCQAGVPTIGYGATFYKSGIKVKVTDSAITEVEADLMLKDLVDEFAKKVDSFTSDNITQNMFDALVCLAYNIGTTALKNSRLLQVININPRNFDLIKRNWLMWKYAGGRILVGLEKRRELEFELYKK